MLPKTKRPWKRTWLPAKNELGGSIRLIEVGSFSTTSEIVVEIVSRWLSTMDGVALRFRLVGWCVFEENAAFRFINGFLLYIDLDGWVICVGLYISARGLLAFTHQFRSVLAFQAARCQRDFNMPLLPPWILSNSQVYCIHSTWNTVVCWPMVFDNLRSD